MNEKINKKVKSLAPIDVEIDIKNERIHSETDIHGKITYVNDYFCEISAFKNSELVGSPHNILRHPCMPSIIFKLLWKSILKGREFSAIIKNKRKDGRYYWVYSKTVPLYDKENKLRGFRSLRHPISAKHVKLFSDIYQKLLDSETNKGERETEILLDFKMDKHGFEDYSSFVENMWEKKLEGSTKSIFQKLWGK